MSKYFRIPDNIQEMIDKMLVIDMDNIESQIETNIANEAFIGKLLYETNDLLIEHEIRRDEKARELRIKYITGNTEEKDISDIRFNRTELDTAINGNREMLVLNQKIKELENMVSYYERVLHNIRSKNFALRDIINWRKFQHGII